MNATTDLKGTEVGGSGCNVLDVRRVPPAERSLLIFQAFESICAGSAFVLITDSDPEAVHRQFESDLSNRFEWKSLEKGPDGWRILVTKRSSRL